MKSVIPLRGDALAGPSGSPSVFDAMDAARALAALGVLIGHLRNMLFLDLSGDLALPWKSFYIITGFGHQSVIIFFVLSGFWITKTVVRRSRKAMFVWTDYAVDRISRLWLVLIPALLLGGALDMVGRYFLNAPLYHGTQGTNIIQTDVAARLGIAGFFGNLFFFQNIFVETFGSNGALWSLANEFWYYVWFPLLYLSRGGGFARKLGAAFAFANMVFFPSLVPGFVCWLFGSVAFILSESKSPGGQTSKFIQLGVVFSLSLFLAVLLISRFPSVPREPADLCLSGLFGLLVYYSVRADWRFPIFIRPLAAFGAKASFSLYVVHLPLLTFICALVAPAQRLPPTLHGLAIFVAIATTATLVSILFSRATEAKTALVRSRIRQAFVLRFAAAK